MKNKTSLVRIVLIILTLSLVLAVFAGCKKENDGANTEGSIGTSAEGDLYDEKGFKKDSLPDMDFHSDEVTVLCWNSEYSEFEVEYGDNVIDNAIFWRNETVEERLGVTLVFEETNGSVKFCGEYKSKVLNAYNGGEYWDIIASYTRSTAICASAGLLKNLGGISNSYLDFEEPWWNRDVIDKTSVGDTFYFCTGDISTNLIQMTYCMYFNADMLSDLKVTSPYELVENNQWTLENMLTINKNVYQDLNENSIADVEDRLGVVGSYYAWPAVLHGCDVPIVEKDSAGSFVMNDAYKGEKAINIMNTLSDAIVNRQIFVDASLDGFVAGKAAFFITESGSGLNDFSKVGFEYGCVPTPKYDSNQENYCSTVRQPITLYGIMQNVPDSRMAEVTATLECLASEGYRQTTPVIFEECMKYLRSTSPEMTAMLELIRDTAWFDCARIYAQETKYVCDMPGRCLEAGELWSGYINDTLPTVEAYIKSLSSKLLSVAAG